MSSGVFLCCLNNDDATVVRIADKMTLPDRKLGEWDVRYPGPQDLYATAIETEFGICVEMKNCALAENFLEHDIYCPEDEAPLTLSWLSSRWHDSTSSPMRRNVQKMPGYCLNNSRFVYQTTINYRRSLNLREGHDSSISEDILNRDGKRAEAKPRHMEDREAIRRTSPNSEDLRWSIRRQTKCAMKAAPKKMWIRHYYLSNGNGRPFGWIRISERSSKILSSPGFVVVRWYSGGGFAKSVPLFYNYDVGGKCFDCHQ